MSLYRKIDLYKEAIDVQRPFEGELLKQLRDYYRIGLTWSSNALEGNSLTEVETKVLLEDGLTIGGKPLRNTLEAVGHATAYNHMFTLLKERDISLFDIKTLHRLFYQQIDEQNAGVWRKGKIFVTGTDYVFPKPNNLESLMLELEQWIKSERDSMHPIRFAAMLHLKFVTVHPYIDGNGRVARLLMNTSLIQDGYMLAIVPPVLRSDYLGYVRLYQQNGDAEQFCHFVAERVFETEREVMRLLHITEPDMN